MSLLTRVWIPDRFLVGLVVAVVLATLVPADGSVAVGFSVLTKIAIALLFFLHGAKLDRSTVIAGMVHWRLHLVVISFTYLVFPVVGSSLGLLPTEVLQPELYVGFLYLCFLPSTIQSSIAFTSMGGGNVPAAICSATLSNLLGVVVTPLLCGLFLAGASGGISFETFYSIAIQILLPFVVGQMVRPQMQSFLARFKTIVGLVDRGSVLLVVYTAFSSAVVSGLWTRVSPGSLVLVSVISFIMLVVIFFAAMYCSRVVGFSRADEICIVFCGSKKSLASGIPMASVIFAGHNLGEILLPVMIFHQIQLMIGAVLAQHWGQKAKALEE